MSKIYSILGKTKEFKHLEDISPYDVIVLEKGSFPSTEGLGFVGKIKKESFALAKANTVFNLVDENNNTLYAQIYYSKLHICTTLEALNKICIAPDLSQYNTIEKKAFDWLESGQTGLSSLTMCKHLLPNVKHEDILSLYDNSYPRDNADFKRCLFLLSSVPELKKDLDLLRPVSNQWNSLINEWSNIENLINTGKSEEAYSLIKQCVTTNKLKI